MATHAGMTTEEFERIVRDWIATAKHPKTGRLYTEMVYQPMLELLAYLRANGFKTFIVSGGGIEFMRPWTEKVYGIPPEQVIGSSIKTKYRSARRQARCSCACPRSNFIDDKAGKPVGIQKHIGRRPIVAFGNSDGDFQMLEWTTAGSGPALRTDRPPRRRRARVRLRPESRRSAACDKGLDEAGHARLGRREHEAGLETRLSGASGEPVASDDGTPARRLTQPPPTLRGVRTRWKPCVLVADRFQG